MSFNNPSIILISHTSLEPFFNAADEPFKIKGIFIKLRSLKEYSKGRQAIGAEYENFLIMLSNISHILPIYIDMENLAQQVKNQT